MLTGMCPNDKAPAALPGSREAFPDRAQRHSAQHKLQCATAATMRSTRISLSRVCRAQKRSTPLGMYLAIRRP